MIGRLRGEVLEVGGGMVTVDVGGVGYEILVPESLLVQMPAPGESVELRIRQVFREDGVSLYGFPTADARRLFDLLLDVKGCGPKIGLALLGQLGEDTVTAAISNQDARTLARASGVGPRLAERIILELKDKVADLANERRMAAAVSSATGARKATRAPEDPLMDALLALGYRRAEAEAAAQVARETSDQVEEQLRAALRSLAR